MPIHPNIRRCIHIKLNGKQCGSPAVTKLPYCYFHAEVKQKRSELKLPVIVNSADVQRAITEVMRGILEGRLDRAQSNALLYALQLSLSCLSANSLVRLRPDPANPDAPGMVQKLLDEIQPISEYEKDLEAQHEEALAADAVEEEMRVQEEETRTQSRREDAKKSIFELDYYRKPTKAEEAELERRVMAGTHSRKKQE